MMKIKFFLYNFKDRGIEAIDVGCRKNLSTHLIDHGEMRCDERFMPQKFSPFFKEGKRYRTSHGIASSFFYFMGKDKTGLRAAFKRAWRAWIFPFFCLLVL